MGSPERHFIKGRVRPPRTGTRRARIISGPSWRGSEDGAWHRFWGPTVPRGSLSTVGVLTCLILIRGLGRRVLLLAPVEVGEMRGKQGDFPEVTGMVFGRARLELGYSGA